MIINLCNTKIKFIIFTLLLCTLFIFQKSNFNTVQTSVNVFLNSVLPSLFPFILFSNILLNSNGLDFLKTIFRKKNNHALAITIGFLCGYPMGAKTVSNLLNDKKINNEDAKFLLSFINNCNPIFILSTIGMCVLNNLKYGVILCISHYLSAIIISLIYFIHNIIHKNVQNSNNFKEETPKILHKSFFEIIDESIKTSLKVLANIFSYITIFNLIFSCINEILQKTNISKNIIYFISSIFEVTNGTRLFYLNTNLDTTISISIISFLLGFSGFAIIFQIYSCVYKNKIPLFHIVKNKFRQGIISSIITFILMNIIKNKEIFNHTFNTLNISPYSYFLLTVSFLYILVFTLKKVT